MKKIYLNLKSVYGVETVDEFQREPGQSPKLFNRYVNKMKEEYQIAGMNVYKSKRCTKIWNQ